MGGWVGARPAKLRAFTSSRRWKSPVKEIRIYHGLPVTLPVEHSDALH